MFCLLLASPPPLSQTVHSASVKGPIGTQYKMPWYVRTDKDGKGLFVAEDDGKGMDVMVDGDSSDDEEADGGKKETVRRRRGWLPWGR